MPMVPPLTCHRRHSIADLVLVIAGTAIADLVLADRWIDAAAVDLRPLEPVLISDDWP
jgi:hypothetical protein